MAITLKLISAKINITCTLQVIGCNLQSTPYNLQYIIYTNIIFDIGLKERARVHHGTQYRFCENLISCTCLCRHGH